MKNTPGIYAIVHLPSGRRYVGSSVKMRSRWKGHRRTLVKGNHHSSYLQRAWNKYGQEEFEFIVLETCDVARLVKREQHYIDQHGEFNACPTAGSQLGIKRSTATKKKLRKLAIKNNSSANLNNPGTLAKRIATNRTPEVKAKRSASALLMHQDPKKHAAIAAYPRSLEGKKKNGARMKEFLNDPDFKHRVTAGFRAWRESGKQKGNQAGEKASFFGRRHTEETRVVMGIARKAYWVRWRETRARKELLT